MQGDECVMCCVIGCVCVLMIQREREREREREIISLFAKNVQSLVKKPSDLDDRFFAGKNFFSQFPANFLIIIHKIIRGRLKRFHRSALASIKGTSC